MKLLYTPNSPYARVARVCALEQKVKMSFVEVTVRERADEILKINPAAMVPTLLLDNGTFLSETRLICEFIENLGTGGFLSEASDFEGRHREGLTTAFLDGVAVWVREIRRPSGEQSPGIIELEKKRAIRCLGHFEKTWEMSTNRLNYASTMLASSLQLIDTRLDLVWKNEYLKLADWYAEISNKSSLQLTAPLPV